MKNKASANMKAFAEELLTDPLWVERILTQWRAGKLIDSNFEREMLHYLAGKPRQAVDLSFDFDPMEHLAALAKKAAGKVDDQ